MIVLRHALVVAPASRFFHLSETANSFDALARSSTLIAARLAAMVTRRHVTV